MREYVIGLLTKYRNSGILLDSNILILYFVGLIDPQFIPNFKPTKIFTIEDYDILVNILQYVAPDKIITTPSILTEVNSFLNKLPEHLKPIYFEKVARAIRVLDEHYLPSANISARNEFRKFGLTDTGIIELVKDNYLVITTDFPLSKYLEHIGVDVFNFNNIRSYNWQ